MVTAEPGAHLHSVEVKLHSLLGEGRTPHVENLGGFDAIVEAAPTLATSPLASEILLAVLRDVVNTAIEDARPWKELIGRLVHGATNDVV